MYDDLEQLKKDYYKSYKNGFTKRQHKGEYFHDKIYNNDGTYYNKYKARKHKTRYKRTGKYTKHRVDNMPWKTGMEYPLIMRFWSFLMQWLFMGLCLSGVTFGLLAPFVVVAFFIDLVLFWVDCTRHKELVKVSILLSWWWNFWGEDNDQAICYCMKRMAMPYAYSSTISRLFGMHY